MQCVAMGLVAAAALAGAARAGGTHPVGVRPCAAFAGPQWTQTINLNSRRPPSRTPGLRVIRGSRYFVPVDHVPCGGARRQVARLVRLTGAAQVRASAPQGFACRTEPTGWFRDAFNGDGVRRASPASSGICTTLTTDAVPGTTYRTLVWSPAKPCRAHFVTDACRRR